MSAERYWLRQNGWDMGRSWDFCWLDCDRPGFLRIQGGRCICLCLEHAVLLQAGCWAGDYDGAPLPPESRATAWPWQEAATAYAA